MHRFGVKGNEIPKRIVGGRRLRETPVRLHLYRMDDVGEFDSILYEKDRNIVADKVPVAFFCVELDGKSPYVAGGIHRAGPAGHSGEADKDGGLLTYLGKHPGPSILLQGGCELEEPVHSRASRMDDTLRNPLVVEMHDLFTKGEILKERRAPGIGPERVLIIGKRGTLVRGEGRVLSAGDLVHFAAVGERFFVFFSSGIICCFLFSHC